MGHGLTALILLLYIIVYYCINVTYNINFILLVVSINTVSYVLQPLSSPAGKRADLLALLCVMFSCVLSISPLWFPGQVWYLIVYFSYFLPLFDRPKINIVFSNTLKVRSCIANQIYNLKTIL